MSEKESTVASYDLITDDLVKQALKNEVGPEAELISWEIKDFTNKGDNYSSIVTSITVNYKINDQAHETSYVAKLNPLRPSSSFTEICEELYARETMVLFEIVNGMNNFLNELNLYPIRAPKLYARNLEKGKETLITENLRRQGFKMYDRTKGMDIKHALLVVEELGRFHASSLLFEETLFPKTIPESFEHFEESWIDVSHPSYKFFGTMMSAQCKNACNFLKKASGYEKCVKWLNSNIDSMGNIFIESLTPSKPFDVLNHGDCWTNNILFKYDENENPIDVRFVDLQCSRKASPACDLNYFYYSSLNGEMRQKYMNTMEKVYYNSFAKVLEPAGKEPPFTYSEFEEEMNNKKRFGLVAGMLLLPAVLAEGDEIWEFDNYQDDNLDEFVDKQNSKFALIAEREGPFKDRFLAMFDEMLKYKIFDD